jgi:hypothetical protein
MHLYVQSSVIMQGIASGGAILNAERGPTAKRG